MGAEWEYLPCTRADGCFGMGTEQQRVPPQPLSACTFAHDVVPTATPSDPLPHHQRGCSCWINKPHHLRLARKIPPKGPKFHGSDGRFGRPVGSKLTHRGHKRGPLETMSIPHHGTQHSLGPVRVRFWGGSCSREPFLRIWVLRSELKRNNWENRL